MDHQKTVGRRNSHKITRSLPSHKADDWFRIPSFNPRRHEGCQPHSMMHRFPQPRTEEAGALKRASHQRANRRPDEEVARHKTRYGIARESEKKPAPDPAENQGLAGSYGDAPEIKLCIQIGERVFNKIILSHGDTAAQQKHVGFQRLLDEAPQGLFVVRSNADFPWIRARISYNRRQHSRVAVAHLVPLGPADNRDHFVSRGDNGNAWADISSKICFADGSEQPDLTCSKPSA